MKNNLERIVPRPAVCTRAMGLLIVAMGATCLAFA